MNKTEFENKYNVNLIDKNDSILMKIVGFLLKPFTPQFMAFFFTTYRLPFQTKGTIAYPVGLDPMRFPDVLLHELMHVEQQKTAWGLFKSALLVSVFPLPMFFSGRWFIEREPYAVDIYKGLRTIDGAVDILWNSYLFPWPKPLMRAFFEKRVKELKEANIKVFL